jgi:hypothetical protein
MDETPTASEIQLAIRVLNTMIDRWSAQRLMLRSTTEDVLPLTANQETYTIGQSLTADFNTAKPIQIVAAYIRDSSGCDEALQIVDQITFDSNSGDKSFAAGRPEMLTYDAGAAQQTVNLGTISIYTMPDSAYTLYIQSDKYLSEFVNPSDVINFEPAYYEAIIYNLAERLYRYYHTDPKQIPMDIVGIAKAAKHTIEVMNSVQYTATMDVPGKYTQFNVYTGDYN